MTRGWATAEASLQNQDAPEEPAEPASRRPGRPRGRNDPTIDWDAIENAYVWGDTLGQREDGSYIRRYPTFKQLGATFAVSPSLVHYYAKRHKWADRRLAVQAKTKEEFDSQLAKSRARDAVNVVEVMDSWLRLFQEQVELKKVRADSIGDLNTVVRLRSFVMGDGDSRTETKLTITLDMLHERHAKQRTRVIDAEGEVAGVVPVEEDPAMAGELPAETEGEGDE